MTKGFALSLDAMLAAIVLLVFMAAFAYLSYQSQSDSLVPLVMKKQAGDLLTSLDKSNQLQSKNITLMNNTLNLSLAGSTSWLLEVYYYNYSSGFVLSETLNASETIAEQEDSVVAEREFLVMGGDSVSQYGIARLSLWVD